MAERPAHRRIAGQADAEAFAGSVIATVALLERVLGEETALLKASRIRDASGLAQAKTDAARNYVHALEAVKDNGVALARWAPAAVARLKQAQAKLTAAVELNLTVLATARSVSEGIMRTLAREVEAPRTLTTYGAGGRGSTPARASTPPLVVSRSF